MYVFEGYLDFQECFEQIEKFVGFFEDKDKDLNNLKEFYVFFYICCIDFNLDIFLCGFILSSIFCSGDKVFVKFVGFVVYQIFYVENYCCFGIFEDFLYDFFLMENYLGFKDMCYVLLVLIGDVEFDCFFVVMCCDFILDVGFFLIDLVIICGLSDICIRNL